jgi:two-component system KDP operon response regulator KdpE
VSAPAPRVLVCDDELQILRALKIVLRDAGFEPVATATAAEALDAAALRPPVAAIVDLVLPDESGIEVCRRLREWSEMPIIVLSAIGEEDQKVLALEAGADDYLTKPFSLRELAVRVRAILRRMEHIRSQKATGPIEHNGLTIDVQRRRALLDGDEVGLTPLEFEILITLARDPGVVLSREQLMDRVWGYRDYAGGRVVDSHVARIRRKLKEDGAEPRFIRTVHGVGYAFRDDA